MLRTDYSKYYPVTGSALNRTNEAINSGGGGGGGGGGYSPFLPYDGDSILSDPNVQSSMPSAQNKHAGMQLLFLTTDVDQQLEGIEEEGRQIGHLLENVPHIKVSPSGIEFTAIPSFAITPSEVPGSTEEVTIAGKTVALKGAVTVSGDEPLTIQSREGLRFTNTLYSTDPRMSEYVGRMFSINNRPGIVVPSSGEFEYEVSPIVTEVDIASLVAEISTLTARVVALEGGGL